MQVIHISYPNDLQNLGVPGGQVLAIGGFDGIHLGHREVLRRAFETGKRLKLPVSVMTFHPHPREVLGQEQYVHVLTPLTEKMERLSQTGVDRTYVVRFNREFAAISPGAFVEDVLMKLSVHTVVVGFDFTFGRGGAGTADTLCAFGKGTFTVEVVRPYHLHSEKVSSSLIRDYVQTGEVKKASLLLGRAYSIRGTVVTGEGRGRTIGVPTANIETSEPYVIPGRGVYAVRFKVNGETVKGVMNIGLKPTFAEDGLKQTLEVHLFDFQRMIYGETVEVDFVGFIRGERKFASVDELVAQIRMDMAEAKELLA